MAANFSFGAQLGAPVCLIMTTWGRKFPQTENSVQLSQGPCAEGHLSRCTGALSLLEKQKKTEAVGQLVPLGSNTLLRFHLRPIDVVVSHGPSADKSAWNIHLGAGFALRCFQRLSVPDIATQQCTWRHNWHTRGASVPVLSYWGPPPSTFLRPPQIETELSYDVLNPARVPL